MTEATSILLTQCLQEDFLRPLAPGEELPNLVHVGRLESQRLCGATGSLRGFLEQANRVDPSKLAIVHVRDVHDPVRDAAHLDRFRPHCLSGTPGAKLVFDLEAAAAGRPETHLVDAGDLNDFEESDLQSILMSIFERRCVGPEKVRVGVIGCWTDAKVSFLLYDLATRLQVRQLAVCSALTASRSLEGHFHALERLRNLLDVAVFHSPGAFCDWLGRSEAKPGDSAALAEALASGRERRRIGGGFSGSSVEVVEGGGVAPEVLKIGSRLELSGERFGNERIGRILGDAIPSLIEYREEGSLAGMRQSLLMEEDDSLLPPATFQSVYQSVEGDEATELLVRVVRRTLSTIMGRLYLAAEKDNADLLEAFGFVDANGTPRYVESVLRHADEIARHRGHDSAAALLESVEPAGEFMTPHAFQTEWLPGKSLVSEVRTSLVHGDLNLANILFARSGDCRRLGGVFLIDFARVARMPSLTDFAKIENDLTYILLEIPDDEALGRARRIQQWRLTSGRLMLEGNPLSALTPDERRYAALLVELRRIASVTDRRGEEAMRDYRVALLRYAAHTLGFDEPNWRQRQLALEGYARLAAFISGT